MLFLETIKCESGQLLNLAYHQARFEATRNHFFPGAAPISLHQQIRIPENAQTGLFRCRVIYNSEIQNIEFVPHQIRPIRSLKLISCASIDYSFKYANRKALEELFARRGRCDDILIVKNGQITDSFTANPIFYDGENWWSPDSPLLPGTQRAKLIAEGKLKVAPIALNQLNCFEKIGLINALQDMASMPILPIKNIDWSEYSD